MKKLLLLLIFSGLIFCGNADAAKFTGDAWLAQYDGIVECYLLLENSGMNFDKVKLKKFALEPEISAIPRDFSELTNGESFFWRDIDEQNSRKIKKFTRKAVKKSNRLVKRGKLDEADQKAWVDKWVISKLAKKRHKLVVKNEFGKKFKAKISLANFNEPFKPEPPGNGGNPVPEPATILLLGTGLAGLAGFGRKKFFKK